MKKRINIVLAVGICGCLLLSTLPAPAASRGLTAPTSLGVSTGRGSPNARKPAETARALASRIKELKRTRRGRAEEPVEGQSATLLADGRSLLIGGQGTDGPLAMMAMREPGAGEITRLPSVLARGRAWHTATMLPDGTILILGGVGADGQVVDTVELFDTETQTLQRLSAAGLTPRAHHTATVMTDGRVLVAGGLSGSGTVLGAEVWDSVSRAVVLPQVKMKTPRYGHSAAVLANGNVLLSGGGNKNGRVPRASEVYMAESDGDGQARDRFVSVDSGQMDPQSAVETPALAASLPVDGAEDVAPDVRIALRFSKLLRVDSLSGATVTLSGPDGTVDSRIVPVEGGRLAFVTPKGTLAPGGAYKLALYGAVDATGAALAYTSTSFVVALAAPVTVEGPDNEQWIPAEGDDWKSGRADSRWRALPPLQAEPGVTAVAGQVLTLDGQPLANVTMKIGDRSTLTDRTGRFLLKRVAPGRGVLTIDGRTASRHRKTYGFFEAGIDVTAGKTIALDFTVWMPVIDTAHEVTIPSPTKTEVVITTPHIPGLEVHIPANTVIRDKDGQPVTHLSITAIPLDRTPFPLPTHVYVPIYFTVQPGGAAVEVVGYGSIKGARVVYPNYRHEPAGKRMEFWHYDPEGTGWYIYGQGSVSADAKQVVPDAGISFYEFTGAMFADVSFAPGTGPSPGNCATDGDPVDLSTGLFVLTATDLVLPDVIPISLTRTYRPQDGRSRPFGIGATHPYEMFLVGEIVTYSFTDLILPDGGRVHFQRISDGDGFNGAVFEHTSSPTAYYGAKIVFGQEAGGAFVWTMTMKDGTELTFPEASMATNPAHAALKRIKDRNGNRVTLIRDSNLNLTKIVSPNGRWIALTPDGSGRITQATDNTGRTVIYTYDGSGRLWKVTDPMNGVTEYTYDSSHRMLTLKDPRGITYLTNQYDANGRVSQQTQADSTKYHFAYTLDGNGKVTQTDVTNPRGNHRVVTFSAGGYTLTDTKGCSCGSGVTYERQTGTNLLSAMTDALNRRTEYAYDLKGNMTSVTRMAGTPEAIISSFTYDPMFSNLTSATDPLNHTTTLGHDSAGNLTSITDPLNHPTTMSYNASGLRTGVTDALGNTTQFTYSGADIIGARNPAGQKVTQFHDGAGRSIAMTNALGRTATYEYDALNRQTEITDPLQGTTAFAYDPNGRLLSVTDPRNNVVSYTYNNMDRLETRKDPLLRQERYTYNENGNLAQFTDRKGQVSTSVYDSLDRVTSVTYQDGSTTSYAYDTVSRLVQVVDSISGTMSYTHDNLNRVLSETTPQGVVSYAYDAGGRRATMIVPGQNVVNYTYDNADRLTQIQQGTATVTIVYDPANRRTSLTLPNGVVTTYTYDSASRLIGLVYSKGATMLGNLTYGYDVLGRVMSTGGSFARTGLPQPLSSTIYNAANQQVGGGNQTLIYDLNGNLISDGINAYTWNSRDQLASISGPGLNASFQYDALGRRSAKTINGTTTAFVYDGSNAVQEKVAGSATANMLTGGVDELFSRTDSASTWSSLTDALGSTVALTDSGGTAQTNYTYEPFGNTAATGPANGNPSQFTGRENDGTGLYYYRARFYSPSLQRFISEDPIGFSGGDLNLYAYVANAPTNSTDPSGTSPVGQTQIWIGPTVIEVLTLAPVGSFRSSFGHTAIRIKKDTDKVYSFGEKGWYVADFRDFMKDNDFRNTTGQELKLTPAQRQGVERYLNEDVADGLDDRWTPANNCSTKARDALQGGAHIQVQVTGGTYLDPLTLMRSLENFGYVAKENFYPKKRR